MEHVISEGGLTKALTHCMSNDYECRNQSLWVVGNISTDDKEAKSRIPCGLEQRARIVAEVSMIRLSLSRVSQHDSSPDIDIRRSLCIPTMIELQKHFKIHNQTAVRSAEPLRRDVSSGEQ